MKSKQAQRNTKKNTGGDKLDNEEIIEQLEELKDYCESMIDDENLKDTWLRDKVALSIAIRILKKEPTAGQQNRFLSNNSKA